MSAPDVSRIEASKVAVKAVLVFELVPLRKANQMSSCIILMDFRVLRMERLAAASTLGDNGRVKSAFADGFTAKTARRAVSKRPMVIP
eukprot:1159095-Pelagomonas_calceolata.AAC.10